MTKHWFRSCIYHGADISAASNLDAVDVFYKVDVEDELNHIPNETFDLVLMKHVIEHLAKPLNTLDALIQKLKPRGILFLSFPHPRSITFPSAEGTLNFYDDRTHIWLPSIHEILETMKRRNVEILKQGTTRSLDRLILGIPFFVANLVRRACGTRMSARGLWDLYGFEYHIVGRLRNRVEERHY